VAIISGLAYPLQVDGNGNLLVASDAELIGTHIRSVLETEPGENPMRLDYGVPGELFNSTSDFSEIVGNVRRALEAEIPQADFQVAGTVNDAGQAQITVDWQVDGEFQEPFSVSVS